MIVHGPAGMLSVTLLLPQKECVLAVLRAARSGNVLQAGPAQGSRLAEMPGEVWSASQPDRGDRRGGVLRRRFGDAGHRRPRGQPPGAAGCASGGVDPGLVVRMLHQWRFVASICLDALGFLAQLIALQRLPLFVVQAFVASNLAVTAVVASRVIGVTLSWREWAAVIGVVAGVGLLGSSAGAEGAAQVGAVFKLALIVAIAGLAVVGLAAAKLNEPYPHHRARPHRRLRLRRAQHRRPRPERLLPARARPRPGRLRGRRGRHHLVHVLRHRPGKRQRDGRHRGRRAGRDHPARHHRRHLPRRPDPSRARRRGLGRVLHRRRLRRYAGQIRRGTPRRRRRQSRRGGPQAGKCRASRRRTVILVARGPAVFHCPWDTALPETTGVS